MERSAAQKECDLARKKRMRKKIQRCDPVTGEVLNTWDCVAMAAAHVNVWENQTGVPIKIPRFAEAARDQAVFLGARWKYAKDVLGVITPKKKTTRLQKKICQYTVGGVFVKEWDSVADAAKFFHCNPSGISGGASKRGRMKYVRQGFKWIYTQDLNPEQYGNWRMSPAFGYEVSDLGFIRTKLGKITRGTIKYQYYEVDSQSISIMVADAFCPVPEWLAHLSIYQMDVEYIDGQILNNAAANLRLVADLTKVDLRSMGISVINRPPSTAVYARYTGGQPLVGYFVTTDGDIYNAMGYKFKNTCVGEDGYKRVALTVGGVKLTYAVHVIVANTFLENDDPVNKIYVNHKNGRREQNFLANLEFVTPRENSAKTVFPHVGHRYSSMRPLEQLDLDMNHIQYWDGVILAATELNISKSSLSVAATSNGVAEYGGFRWRYVVEDLDYGEWRESETYGYLVSSNGFVETLNGRYTRGSMRNGYLAIGKKMVHHIVADAFISKPAHIDEDDLVVNHRSGVRTQNFVANLEYTDIRGNTKHAIETGLMVCIGTPRKVICVDPNLRRTVYNSVKEAAEAVGLASSSGICDVCLGRAYTSGGCAWAYTYE